MDVIYILIWDNYLFCSFALNFEVNMELQSDASYSSFIEDTLRKKLWLYLPVYLPQNRISKLMKDFLPLQWVPVFINQSPTWFSEAWLLLKLQWWGLNAAYSCSCQWVEVIIQDSVFSLLFGVIEQGTICNFHVSLDTNYNFIESSAAKAAVFASLCHMWERPLHKVILYVD